MKRFLYIPHLEDGFFDNNPRRNTPNVGGLFAITRGNVFDGAYYVGCIFTSLDKEAGYFEVVVLKESPNMTERQRCPQCDRSTCTNFDKCQGFSVAEPEMVTITIPYEHLRALCNDTLPPAIANAARAILATRIEEEAARRQRLIEDLSLPWTLQDAGGCMEDAYLMNSKGIGRGLIYKTADAQYIVNAINSYGELRDVLKVMKSKVANHMDREIISNTLKQTEW